MCLEVLKQFDAVAVFYAPAWERGATWRQSTGNKFKDDYRRLAKPYSLLPHPNPSLRGVYEEITGLMTEEALDQILREL